MFSYQSVQNKVYIMGIGAITFLNCVMNYRLKLIGADQCR